LGCFGVCPGRSSATSRPGIYPAGNPEPGPGATIHKPSEVSPRAGYQPRNPEPGNPEPRAEFGPEFPAPETRKPGTPEPGNPGPGI